MWPRSTRSVLCFRSFITHYVDPYRYKKLMKTPDKILKFYQSIEWKRIRRLKRQISKGICEQCGNAGWEVHHKIPLTLTNIDNPEVSMGLNNLELLCSSCHNAKRATEAEIRDDICFDSQGNVHYKHPPGLISK